jgi:polyketide cyclase/dehydrase/lipid transport protein
MTRRRLRETVADVRIWTATTTVQARPEAVLDILTDPEACRRWAPIAFDIDELATDRLCGGSRARVSGRLAGRRIGFDVEIHEAHHRVLSLSAIGPVGFDVRYDLEPAARGSEVRASVCVWPGSGFTGRLLAEATNALLAAGALQTAVLRIAREAAVAA